MQLEDVMAELEQLGTAQNRKTYARHGAKDPMFGVSFANLDKLKKKIKVDHALAEALWASGNHDARVLATKIADPKLVERAQLEAWAHDLDNYGICDLFSGYVARTPHARALMQAWTPRPAEWIGRTGWLVLANLTLQDQTLSDADLMPYLVTIETEIHRRANYVRDAMNSALIAIGLRSPTLQEAALAVAAAIGKVEVDHGQTNCKTPDAAAYIRKAAARKGREGKSPEASRQ